MPIRCEIVSQDRTVFQGDADMVILPGAGGEMGILPHHAPVLTTLKYGVVRVRQTGVEKIFAVAGGVAEVRPDLVTVLADAAENVEEIDVKRASVREEARRRSARQRRTARGRCTSARGSRPAALQAPPGRRTPLSQDSESIPRAVINRGPLLERLGH